MTTPTSAINNLILQIEQGPLNYFLALAGLGVLTMSIIQAAKNLLPIRRHFHRWALRIWLAKRAVAQNLALEEALIRLAVDGNESALYDADTEELCRNLEAVGQLAIDYPYHKGFDTLLEAMTSSHVSDDIKTLTDSSITGEPRLEARDRVRQHLAQSLNAFRLSTTAQWQRMLHVSSLVISFLIAFFAILGTNNPNYYWAPVSALLAAFIAPVARDIVAGIEGLRKG